MAKAYIEPGSWATALTCSERTGDLTEKSESNENTIQLRSVHFEPGRRCHALRVDRFAVRLGCVCLSDVGQGSTNGFGSSFGKSLVRESRFGVYGM